MIPTIPAVMNANYDTGGVRTKLPAAREGVLEDIAAERVRSVQRCRGADQGLCGDQSMQVTTVKRVEN